MNKLIQLFVVAVFFTACASKTKSTMNQNFSENPFAKESTLPYFAPDFTKINNADFMPAFQEGMKQQNDKINAIANSKDEPTFENTILELEKSGELLDRVSSVFFALSGAHTNDSIKQIQKEISPKFAQHSDGIRLNEKLFSKIETLYNKKDELNLDDESLKLLEENYNRFVLAGAKLDTDSKKKLKEINAEIASLNTKFNQTLLEANNAAAIVVSSKELLGGLSESKLKSLKSEDGNSYKLPIQNTTQQPLLQSLANREMRKKIFEASIHRADKGEHNTNDIVLELAKLRLAKAKLLGFDTYADWSLQNTMVQTPEKVKNFFKGLIPAATAKAQKEADDIQDMINQSGEKFMLEPWDWNLYGEKVRKAKYNLDESEIKPYFELKNVLENGVFYAANQLYGITAKERTDLPTYHEDVLVYELFEEDGTPLGLFYGDFFSRPSKRGGAWMSNFVTQSKLYNKKPVIYNVCNYSKPAEGEPALLSYDDVETMFHEFGHALHGFFANQMYPSLSGTSVARDFVEFPSQVNENWALHPKILANYAVHYKTGEKMPAALVEKIKKASTFNQGYSLTEVLAAANLDMQWHTVQNADELTSVAEFQKNALKNTKLDVVTAVPPRYGSTYFAHVFGGGYAAGYYSYLWTEMLHHDAYQGFVENGGLTRENGQRFRDMVLSQGNTKDYAEMYRKWRGADPKILPMEKARGLK